MRPWSSARHPIRPGRIRRGTHASGDPHGEIKVTVDYPHRHMVLLKQGHSLLAPAPGYS
ncbi:MAG TPA: hypothetical protein VHV75_05715 [Solirubrobacteraceae bacterium]|nr:hypothetical protein [Solirubrobacteraceae bacterium]